MKKLIIILLLFPACCLCQQRSVKKHFFSKNDKQVVLLQFIAGSADGINQAIQVHGLGKGHSFWDYNTSWKRKYKDFDNGDLRAAYPFAKSLLVAGTDGYHLTRFVNRSSFTLTMIIDRTDLKSWRAVLRKIVIASMANRLGFYIFYDNVFAP
jgi:hypothetical protein